MLLRKLILVVILLTSTLYSFSQIERDTIPRYLIPPMIGNTVFYEPPYYPPYPPYDPPIYPPYPFIDWDIGNYTFIYSNPCGEHFYDNGNISSRCECNTDSILHGKAIYWDQRGRITNVHIYRNGKIYKSKNYNEGKLNEVVNYRYDSEGFQKKHGIHIDYAGNTKTTTNYNMDVKDGAETVYIDNKKITENEFTDGRIKHRLEWFPSGQMKVDRNFDSKGRINYQKIWNESGALIKAEQSLEGYPFGDWININARNGEKHITTYEEGKKIKTNIYTDSILKSHTDFKNGTPSHYTEYYPNQEKFIEINYLEGGITKYEKWNDQGLKTEDYSGQGNRFINEGFYYANTTDKYVFKNSETDNTSIMVRWKVIDGDTTQMDYLPNAISQKTLTKQVIASNIYTKNSLGKYVKNGLWKTYEDNEISNALTYAEGVLDGRAVYYQKTKYEPIPVRFGNYKNGLKNGEWTFDQDSISEVINYSADLKHGSYSKLKLHYDTLLNITNTVITQPQETPYVLKKVIDTLIVANYASGKLNGELLEFNENGDLISSGKYINGKKDGIWKVYFEDGKIQKEAEFKNGTLKGRWYEWTPNKKGVLKRRKIS